MTHESVLLTKLHFAVEFDQKPDREVSVMAYAFDREGKLLDQAPVRDGQVELAMAPGAARSARIFFAPADPAHKEEEVTLSDMERLNAHQPPWRFDPEQKVTSHCRSRRRSGSGGCCAGVRCQAASSRT